MTAATMPAAENTRSVGTARRRGPSRLFWVLLALVLVPALLLGGFLALQARGTHAYIEEQANARLANFLIGYVQEPRLLQAGPLGSVTSQGLQVDTVLQRVGQRDYIMTTTGSDGFVVTYDSRTGFREGHCTSLACFFS